MTICVIHPNVCRESAKTLADAFGWEVSNPFQDERRDYTKYDGVFNYGCNRRIYAKNIINKKEAVATCVDKVETFKAFNKAGVPTVGFCTKKEDIPVFKWNTVVVRDKVDGARAEGLDYWTPDWNDAGRLITPLPNGALFTEYFEHVKELRVMVFCGQVVGAYKKVEVDGGWHFQKVHISKDLTGDAIKAAKALDIDYVGFDVLVAKDAAYVFLEANSGPILVEEMVDEIKKYLNPKD